MGLVVYTPFFAILRTSARFALARVSRSSITRCFPINNTLGKFRTRKTINTHTNSHQRRVDNPFVNGIPICDTMDRRHYYIVASRGLTPRFQQTENVCIFLPIACFCLLPRRYHRSPGYTNKRRHPFQDEPYCAGHRVRRLPATKV